MNPNQTPAICFQPPAVPGEIGECINHVRFFAAAAHTLGIKDLEVGVVYPTLNVVELGKYVKYTNVLNSNTLNATKRPQANNFILQYDSGGGTWNTYLAVLKVSASVRGVATDVYFAGYAEPLDWQTNGDPAYYTSPTDVMDRNVFGLVWNNEDVFSNTFLWDATNSLYWDVLLAGQ